MEFFDTYINNAWVYWSLTLAYFATILGIVGVVISENRNPLKSLAWVTVLLLFPVGGIILYFFFGRSIKNKRMISRRNRRRLYIHSHDLLGTDSEPEDLSAENRRIIRLGRSLLGANYYEGNDITLYTDGPEKFEALLKDIAGAREYIHLQYYIINDDATGRHLANALIAKAAEGVKVRVIYDDIGSLHISRKFVRRLTEAGVEIHPFFKVAFPPFATRINWRNHRKVAVIDGHTGYIGGMNIADRYMTGGKFARWRDTHLRVTGPAVAGLQYSFAVDWKFMGQPLLEERAGGEPVKEDGIGVQMITSGPTSRWSNIAFMMLKAIGSARRRIFIQTPYFLPNEALLKALQTAALARVDVRVMMPVKSDSVILTAASRSYIGECLRAGIKIYLYTAGMLHAKTMVVDDEFSSVGSTNFDFRSFEHNFEGNFFMYGRRMNAIVADTFEQDMQNCVRVKLSEWHRRPLLDKARESLARLLSPIL